MTGGTDAFEHLASTDNGILAVGYRNAEDLTTLFCVRTGHISFSMPTAICSATTASTSICLRPTGLSQLAMATSLLVGPRMPCNMGSSKSMPLAMCFGAGRLAATTRTIASEWTRCRWFHLLGWPLSGTANWDTYTETVRIGHTVVATHKAIPVASTRRTSMMKHGASGHHRWRLHHRGGYR